MNAVSEISGQRSQVSGRRSEIAGQTSDAGENYIEKRKNNQAGALSTSLHVALLTGGGDRPYVLGLVEGLTSANVLVEVIGSDQLSLPELLRNPRVNFLNLRGDQSSDASFINKIRRITRYYWRIIRYAATASPRVFHILWNNKFELFDRTLLMLYYKAVGKKITMTAHNVNMRKRDRNDNWLNRLTLRIQYHLMDHIFVHADKMKSELVADFNVHPQKVTVIPFGINNTSPRTGISSAEAKARLGLTITDKTMLCFGQIAPYKGLEYLIEAFSRLATKDNSYRLVIAGKPKWNENYWREIERLINDRGFGDRIIRRVGHVPDEETEVYFKAADVLVLPYVEIFQSGVISLAYSFGLPVIAADVGSLKQSIVEGETGYVFRAKNSADLVNTIDKYYRSELFSQLERFRLQIIAYANECYSWRKAVRLMTTVYSELLLRHRIS